MADDGQVFAFGQNGSGQLGLGDCKDRAVPTEVEALRGMRVKRLAAGASHAAAVVVALGRGGSGSSGGGADSKSGGEDAAAVASSSSSALSHSTVLYT